MPMVEQLPMEISAAGLWLILSINMLLGLGLCFFGFRLIKPLLGLWGLMFGASIGLAIAQYYGYTATAVRIGFAGGCGFLTMIAAIKLWWLAVFFFGVTFGAAMTVFLAAILNVFNIVNIPNNIVGGAAVVAAIVCGVLCVILHRPVIIVVSSLSGASSVVYAAIGTLMLIGMIADPQAMTDAQGTLADQTAWQAMIERGRIPTQMIAAVMVVGIGALGWVVLAAGGMIVQFLVTAKAPQPEPLPPVTTDYAW